MKKFFKIIICCLLMLVVLPVNITTNKANASAINYGNYVDFKAEVESILAEYSKFTNRYAGSEGEKEASNYIIKYLEDNTNLIAKESDYINSGIQEFQFESRFTGKYATSQNIIYTYNSSKQTDKKVIIACHYDSVAYNMDIEELEDYGKSIESESINGSAANVALLLTVARFVENLNFDFNLEIVFFGAGDSDNSGSRIYTQGISSEEKKNILCMINVDNIAVGENIYYYTGEIENKFNAFLRDIVKDNKLNSVQVDTVHLNKLILDETTIGQDIGIGYTHIALQSDNANFIKNDIQTLHIFAGDYSNGVVIGRNEFSGTDVITYTKNDNLDYINKNYETGMIATNLYEVYKLICTSLTDFDFRLILESVQGSNSWFYSFFSNTKLIVFITVVAFITLVAIAMYLHYKLTVKAYHANVEVEFLSSVVNISEQIDSTGTNENVAKVVSQVIANDIKKDKTIKTKHRKNNDKNKD